MPPFFDPVQIHDALQNQANPVLEALAANDHVRSRSLRRFERDDPPPYASSTESDEFGDDFLAPPPQLPSGELPQELMAIMEQPISDGELKRLAHQLGSILRPIDFYYTEAKFEEYRVERWRYWKSKIFRGLEGSRRCGVIVRHNVKRRWEKLGVWNPQWGFPGRKLRPSDDAHQWQWRWEQHIDDDSAPPYSRSEYVEELIRRALRLRQNLHRRENAPIVPRSRLEQDATASQAESFLISRPWVIFQIEMAEEQTRYFRLSIDQRNRHPHSARKQVIKWWKERGDWREEFDRNEWVTSWKWRHESPSPEPEDLAPTDKMKESPLETTDMDFSPSEIEDLETIELPRSEQPKGYWTTEEEDGPPYFPGQCADLAERAERRLRSLQHLEPPSFARESRPSIFGPLEPPPEEEYDEASIEEHDSPSSEREPTSAPLQESRQPQPRLGVDMAQNGDQAQPLPRRSARIAAMKRPAEPLPRQATEPPNKRRRVRRTVKAAEPAAPEPTARETRRTKMRPVPARPAPGLETHVLSKRGRGRVATAKGEGVEHSRSPVAKPARTPAPVRTRGRRKTRKNEYQ